MSRKVKLLVADTQGSEITDRYRALLPGLNLRGIDSPGTEGESNPHGAWCGWLAGIPLIGAGVHGEILFVKIFDSNGCFVPGALEALLDVIAEEEPTHITRSWGAWDGDQPLQEMMAQMEFEDWVVEYMDLQEKIGFLDFGAAGNDDANDKDADIDYPQCLLPNTNVIGACSRSGVPCWWSGDGPTVQCVMWADRIYSPAIDGVWSLWSGTSGATPKACGVAAALGDTQEQWVYRISHLPETCRPDGDFVLPHPKWGYGCAEELWQQFARRVSPAILPAYEADEMPGEVISQHDYALVPLKADEEEN